MACDLREARQKYSDKKLETLIKVLDQLDCEEDDTPLHKLCRKTQLSAESLKLHHRYASHFRNDWETYDSAVADLEKQCYEMIRDGVLRELRKIKFKPGKEPSLLLIQNIAKKQPASDWNKKNTFTLTWAKEVRILFRKHKVNEKHMRNNQSKKFLLYIKWVTEYMKTHDRISYLLAKQKYTQLIGEIKSSRAWSHFSR